MMIPFAFMNQGQVFPDLPSLKVLSGQTVNLAGGNVYQYLDIEVEAGGTLRITGEAGGWTEILCARDMILNGTILCRAGYDGGSTHGSGTFTKTSAIGLGSLSYSITQRSGSAGGVGSSNVSGWVGGLGGAQSNGSGGGGGGGGGGSTGNEYDGENGGSGNGSGRGNGSNGGSYNGGAGASNGGSGETGGGGGGGYKGHHGKGLAIKVGRNISGSGSFNLSGRNGFNGGAGNNRGAAGGRGAGGSGGKLVLRYKNGVAPTAIVTGGTGGTSGNGTAQSGDAGSVDMGVL